MSEPSTTNNNDENKNIVQTKSKKKRNKNKKNNDLSSSSSATTNLNESMCESTGDDGGSGEPDLTSTNLNNENDKNIETISTTGEDGSGETTTANNDMLVNVRGLVEQIKLNTKFYMKPAKTPEESVHKSYKFWSTQPVPRMDEKIQVNESIEADKSLSDIRSDPYSLPDGFQWDTINIDEPLVLKELYILLNENYVEDDDAMFRFDYQPEFLKWALQPPGWRKEWHVGVRIIKSGRLVGFISAIPGNVKIYDKLQKIVEINFLCVHKKLRSKRVAPVLIREITRRVNLTGIFQAVYTAGVVLPKPVSTSRYWHRSLNPKKLIEVSSECFILVE